MTIECIQCHYRRPADARDVGTQCPICQHPYPQVELAQISQAPVAKPPAIRWNRVAMALLVGSAFLGVYWGNARIEATKLILNRDVTAIQATQSTLGPRVTQGKDWEFVVNAAIIAADEYLATKRPEFTFLNATAQLQQQSNGSAETEWRLVLMVNMKGHAIQAVLRPTFSVHQSAQELGPSESLWILERETIDGSGI